MWQQFHGVNSSPNIYSDDQINGIKTGGACGKHRHNRGVHRVLVRKPEVKGTLGRLVIDGKIMLKWIFIKIG